ncbi:DUF2809 domain-containing protein [Pendulispora rubella]|uniref:DUF2809 domain-containing protein n=1 Tax=Pendulispora rubella TaxID=2741070 RepID=A0ABZ2LN68_9BACT
MAMHPAHPSRLVAIAAAFIVLFAGLAVRAWAGGAFAKYAGVALYGSLVYTLVVTIAPRLSPWRAAGIALAFCWAIELGQLTGIPASLATRSKLARLVLGTTFNVPDLFWYAAGVAPVAGADKMLRSRTSETQAPR